MRILLYLNQFFSQQGGEEKTGISPLYIDHAVGPGILFNTLLKEGKIFGALVCGDNYYAENIEAAREELLNMAKELQPDLFIAGPAFNAGRYGMACADLAHAIKDELGIPVLTGMYEENPAVEIYKKELPIIRTSKSAAGMKDALISMALLADKMLRNDDIGLPEEENLLPMGKRVNIFKKDKGAKRAVKMLLAKMRAEPFRSEIPIPIYEQIEPAPPVKDLTTARIALLTSGGIVPEGNPDHLPAATAKFYKKYYIADLSELEEGKYESVHAGYDPVYANENPNRVAPLDLLKEKERTGEIGSLYPYLITTTGNSTSVSDATRMGQEIAKELLDAKVNGAIMTST